MERLIYRASIEGMVRVIQVPTDIAIVSRIVPILKKKIEKDRVARSSSDEWRA